MLLAFFAQGSNERGDSFGINTSSYQGYQTLLNRQAGLPISIEGMCTKEERQETCD